MISELLFTDVKEDKMSTVVIALIAFFGGGCFGFICAALMSVASWESKEQEIREKYKKEN